ncbi:MAG: biopolymer transporter ExbD [Deltaproteobacteria bacterium]|nr:biopolymer transporter ExbD [Deltaproteobacteria bacterium]
MRVNIKTGKKPRIEMLPLIDIVFLLLVFFIYAMLSMAVHRGLPVTLPSSTSVEVEKEALLSVTLRSDGSIYLDRIKISLDRLRESLEKAVSNRKETGVLLFADRSVSFQDLFRVMDEIRLSGINRISLQAEMDQQP